MAFVRHNPEKFQNYTNTKNGFLLDYQPFLYRYDDDGGWADINGCYYDSNANPAGWVFVQNNTYERYNMDHQFIESKQNLFYPVTILEQQEQQKEENQQVQKSFQKSSYGNYDEDLRYQKKNDDHIQSGIASINEQANQKQVTLREYQQSYKKQVEQFHGDKLDEQYRPQFQEQPEGGMNYARQPESDNKTHDQNYRNQRNNHRGGPRQFRNNDREYNNDQNYSFQERNNRDTHYNNNNYRERNNHYGDRNYMQNRNHDYHQRNQYRQYGYNRNDDNRQQRNYYNNQGNYNPFVNQNQEESKPQQSYQYQDNHKEFDYHKKEQLNDNQHQKQGTGGGQRYFNYGNNNQKSNYERKNNYRNYNDRPHYNRNDNFQNQQHNEKKYDNGIQNQKFQYVLSKDENMKKQDENRRPTFEEVAQVFQGIKPSDSTGRERKSRLNDSAENKQQRNKEQ